MSKEKGEAKQQKEAVDRIIHKCVEEIWFTYDTDGNGYLDKDETRQFVKFILALKDEDPNPNDESKDDKSSGEQSNDLDVFNEKEFSELFTEFDENESETIEKEEMIEFIKRVALIK